MQKYIFLSIAVAVLICAPVCGCFEDITGPAYFGIEEGERFPCLGVKRFRVVVTDGQSEKSIDNFGDYYDQDGRCRQPIYAHAEFEGLNTGTMMVMMEGYDSSEKRLISSGSLGPISKEDADRGYLGTMIVDREPVVEGWTSRYSTGTLVVDPLPQIDEVENIDSIGFIVNPGKPDSISGRILTDPEVPLKDTELVFSSISPFELPGMLIMVARYKNVSVGQWSNSNAFMVEESDTFVEVLMAKEPR